MKSLTAAKSKFVSTLLALAVFSFVVNILLLVMPFYMLQIYDRILPSQSMDTLIYLSIIAGTALLVLGLLEMIRSVLASRAGASLEAHLGADAIRLSMQENKFGARDIQPLRSLAVVRQFISSRALFAFLDAPFSPIFIGILYIIHPVLFYLTLTGAIVLFILAVVTQKLITTHSSNATNEQNRAFTSAQSLSQNAETLNAMGMLKNGIELWGRSNAKSLMAQDRVDFRNALLSGLAKTLRMGLQIAILGVGAVLVLKNEMTAGMIFAASIISSRGLQPIDQLIGSWRQFTLASSNWKILKTNLKKMGSPVEKTIMPAPTGTLSIDKALVLSQAGAAKQPILNYLTFDIAAGDVLGIVGPSGSGKSTLARMLVGALKPDAGSLRIDGTEIQNWDASQLGQHIGYLGQEVEMLPGTVKENIARLDSNPNDTAVLEAAQKAQVHELVQKLPKGYDTLIGPGGMQLSGGQRQRIGLARAFYGNPQIMILDEPNASLDDVGEMALHQALVSARKAGVTIVIITQRKQVLNIVDRILRLHNGNMDFIGSRDEFAAALQQHRQKAQQKPPNHSLLKNAS